MIQKRIAGGRTFSGCGSPDVRDLQVRIEEHEGSPVFCSAWEPTPADLEALNAGGSVVLRVLGVQPPVALYVEPVGD